MTAVALVGSSGLIGSGIVEALRGNAQLVSLSRRSVPSFDITDIESVRRGLPKKIDSLVHAAGIINELTEDTNSALRYSGEYTYRLFEEARQRGMQKLVYMSSQHVYGVTDGRITESSPLRPQSTYALCHQLSEDIAAYFSRKYSIRVLILRPTAVYGFLPSIEGFQRWSLIPYSFPRSLVESGKIVLKSSGLQSRQFVSSVRLGGYVKNFLRSSGEPIEILNPQGEECMTVLDFARYCGTVYKEVTGNDFRIEAAQATAEDLSLRPLEYISSKPAPQERLDLGSFVRRMLLSLRKP